MIKRDKKTIFVLSVVFIIVLGIILPITIIQLAVLPNGGGGELEKYDSPPSKPILNQPTSPETDGTINLDWSDSERVISYTVWKKYGSLGTTETIAFAITVSHYTDYETRNGEWWYRIVAINALTDDSIGRAYSDWKIVKVDIPSEIPPENQKPIATIIFITPNSANQGENIIISFNGYGTDSDGSIVKYKWLSVVGGIVSILEVGSSFSRSADELSVGRHRIKFRVKDNDGEWSLDAIAILNIYEEIVILPPDAPILDDIESPDTDGDIILIWSTVIDVTSYNVYYSENGISFNEIASGISENTYTHLDRIDGTYYYRITAVNIEGESEYSNTKTVTVEIPGDGNGDGIPDVPVQYHLPDHDYDGEINLKWFIVSDADSYNIYRSIDGITFTKIAYEIEGNTYTDSNRTNGIYYYKITAVNENGESDYSDVESIEVLIGESEDITLPIVILVGCLVITGFTVYIIRKRKKRS